MVLHSAQFQHFPVSTLGSRSHKKLEQGRDYRIILLHVELKDPVINIIVCYVRDPQRVATNQASSISSSPIFLIQAPIEPL